MNHVVAVTLDAAVEAVAPLHSILVALLLVATAIVYCIGELVSRIVCVRFERKKLLIRKESSESFCIYDTARDTAVLVSARVLLLLLEHIEKPRKCEDVTSDELRRLLELLQLHRPAAEYANP